ncbi:hypothetical protein PWT90_03027 [Aphanocladium album]|nr:hypothetical protein PWT90_03027 [Aphanocladium album]
MPESPLFVENDSTAPTEDDASTRLYWDDDRITLFLGFSEGRFNENEEQLKMTNEVVATLEDEHNKAGERICALETSQRDTNEHVDQIQTRFDQLDSAVNPAFECLHNRIVNLEMNAEEQREQLRIAHQLIAMQQEQLRRFYDMPDQEDSSPALPRCANQTPAAESRALPTAPRPARSPLSGIRDLDIRPPGQENMHQPHFARAGEHGVAFRIGYNMGMQAQRDWCAITDSTRAQSAGGVAPLLPAPQVVSQDLAMQLQRAVGESEGRQWASLNRINIYLEARLRTVDQKMGAMLEELRMQRNHYRIVLEGAEQRMRDALRETLDMPPEYHPTD